MTTATIHSVRRSQSRGLFFSVFDELAGLQKCANDDERNDAGHERAGRGQQDAGCAETAMQDVQRRAGRGGQKTVIREAVKSSRGLVAEIEDPARQIVRAQQSTGKRAPDRVERDGGENAERGLMRALDEEIERGQDLDDCIDRERQGHHTRIASRSAARARRRRGSGLSCA